VTSLAISSVVAISSRPDVVVVSWSSVPAHVPTSVIEVAPTSHITYATVLSGPTITVTTSRVPSSIPLPVTFPTEISGLGVSSMTVII
jgi:hypothetical protein